MSGDDTNIEVFFNKPVRPFDVSKLIDDIRGARQNLIIASAWFTDTGIARAFIDAPVKQKAIILNRSDVNRGSKRAYEMIKEWNEKHVRSWEYHSGLYVLGSGDWQEGVMHHKFALIDRQVVWVGSYNFTFQARNNYETILRIQSAKIFQEFWKEACQLIKDEALFMGGFQFAQANGAFRCCQCGKLFPESAIGNDMGTWMECVYCKKEREDS